MADLIERSGAIDELKDMYQAAEKWGREADDDVIKARAESCMASLIEMKLRIEKLPSAQTEQRWIPCKVQNPKETGLYTVTLYIEELNDRMLDLAWYDEEKKGWARYEEKGWAKDRPVIAWMEPPILYNPIPYKEEQNVD